MFYSDLLMRSKWRENISRKESWARVYILLLTSVGLVVWNIWLSCNSMTSDKEVLNAHRCEWACPIEFNFIDFHHFNSRKLYNIIPEEWRLFGIGRRLFHVWPLRTRFSALDGRPAGLDTPKDKWTRTHRLIVSWNKSNFQFATYTWREVGRCCWLHCLRCWPLCKNSVRNESERPAG